MLQSLPTSASTSAPPASSSLPWKSVVSTNPDLYEAITEIATTASANDPASGKYNVAIFYTSSLYEASAYRYDTMFATLKQSMPSMTILIGCTAGAVVGPVGDPWGEPSEVEARASISVTFAAVEGDIEASMFYVDADGISSYIKDKSAGKTVLPAATTPAGSSADAGTLTLLFATEQAKNSIGQFVTSLGDKEGVEVFGAVASSVTSLHVPRVYIATSAGAAGMQRYSTGVAGLVLRGNVCVQTVIARSCLPVGPLFSVTEVAGPTGREIMAVKRETTDDDASTSVARSPLEQLDDVLNEIPNDLSYSLKRELLVGLVAEPAADLRAKGQTSIMASKNFFGQKPLTFDPLSGSITVPSSPGLGSSFQFCIRDSTSARQDLLVASEKLQQLLKESVDCGSDPLALMMIGSMERGNKVFRYQSYEALQMYSQLTGAGLAGRVPVTGLFSYGAFARLQNKDQGPAKGAEGRAMAGGQCALMEADSVYAYITKRPTKVASSGTPSASVSASASASAGDSVPVRVGVGSQVLVAPEDICTAGERVQFNDELDSVLVTKRDPESAHPVRVASMDYVVPEKAPQPKNVLESLVWDREKDVDRMRERFQMARALVQAKASEGKFPRRDLIKTVREANARASMLSSVGGGIPPILVELNRASLHNGKLGEEGLLGNDRAAAVLGEMARDSVAAGAVVVGCNADAGTFRGQFEDLETLRGALTATNTPVFCNDFVVYGYQLFRAKASGADAVKLMAAVLSVQDIEYLVKIAKSLGLVCIVVVSSKVQLLDVLKGLPTLQALSVSSRNMRLWKIDTNKAARILQDPEVIAAIAAKRAASVQGGVLSEGDFLLFQEAFTNHEELVGAKSNGVDGVFLGEELLLGKGAGIKATVEMWKLP